MTRVAAMVGLCATVVFLNQGIAASKMTEKDELLALRRQNQRQKTMLQERRKEIEVLAERVRQLEELCRNAGLDLPKGITATRPAVAPPPSPHRLPRGFGYCPLRIESARLGVGTLDTPEAYLVVRNVSDSNVVAYTVEISCWNAYDEPVTGWGYSRFLSQRVIEPGRASNPDYRWVLHGRDTAKKIKIVLLRVRRADGFDWRPAPGEEVSITASR